jgi:toxin ParE1/3/4
LASVVFSPAALSDLWEIEGYIAHDDSVRASGYIDELVDACNGLADFPRRFRKTPRYGADAHVRVHGNYVIVYDVIGDEVRINAVVHRARDMDALLG